MHLKAFSTPKKISASALHEVSSQALKNLGYLQPYVRDEPSNVERWSGRWDGGAIGRVDRRIRKGQATSGKKRGHSFAVRFVIRRPAVRCGSYWGRVHPEAFFWMSAVKMIPKAELIQMLYSLQSTWTSVASLGASLRRLLGILITSNLLCYL